MSQLSSASPDICRRVGAAESVPRAEEKLGIALVTLHLLPLNAMRHPPENGTCGWYIWGGGECSQAPDFFASLHVSHLAEYAPALVSYVALPPGWRVLLAPGQEDVWFDEALLDVQR
jgi:hypothetical protein